MKPAGSAWRVWVSENDLRDARAAWMRARDGGAPPEQVRELLDELERLIRTAVYQAEGDPEPTWRGPRNPTAVASLSARRFLRPPTRLSPTG
jgi:hypothetical protein